MPDWICRREDGRKREPERERELDFFTRLPDGDFSFFPEEQRAAGPEPAFSFFRDDRGGGPGLPSPGRPPTDEYSLDRFLADIPELPTYDAVFDKAHRDNELVPLAGEVPIRILRPSPDELAAISKVAANCCLVCREAFAPADVLVGLPLCEHRFHKNCFVSWLARGSRTCPTCRRNFLGRTLAGPDSAAL